MIRGVIFDFNGTLFFDAQYQFKSWDFIKREVTGEALLPDEMHENYDGVPNIETLRRMSNGRLSRKECEAYSNKKEQVYRQLVADTPGGPELCKGAYDVFSLLKENKIPFTIASASIKENVDFFVRIFHLDEYMDSNLIVYDDGRYHDKVEMFRDAEDRIGIHDHVLIFEDSISGIRCASEAGASLIVIDTPSLRDRYRYYPEIQMKIKDLSQAYAFVKDQTERY
jgi:beta-phosphoglucomutase-like phosphatase (HAD superfamily)